ncbi:MAG: hypothetical protein H6586_03930 [Flavobacteriales bacterium]|nr:hypothetical protein [Flavobacteriales bacterium]
MKTIPMKNIEKATLFVILLVYSHLAISQVKEVAIDPPNAQEFKSNKVHNKGVLVSYSTVDYQSIVSFNPTLIFYDSDLNLKWELKDYSKSEIKKPYYDMYYNKIPKTQGRGVLDKSSIYVSPSGEYVYTVNYQKSNINLIDVASGKLTEIHLDMEVHLTKQEIPEYSLDAFVDDNYFYLVEGNNYYGKSDAKNAPSVFVRRIKHGETKAETFTINPKSPEDDKEGVYKRYLNPENYIVRQWENLMVVNNVLVLMDNYVVENKDTKQFFKKILICPIEGGDIKEVFVKMGEKIADNDLLGEVLYDNTHNRIYTYSLNKDNGELIVSYRCYDSKLELVWEKNYDSKLGKQVLQKVINPAVLKVNYDNSLTIKSRYGDNHYYLRTDPNGDNPEFIINETCSQGKLDEDDGYTLDCHEFNNLQSFKDLKSYILKDKNSNNYKVNDAARRIMKNKGSWNLNINFYLFENRLIYAKGAFAKNGFTLTSFNSN